MTTAPDSVPPDMRLQLEKFDQEAEKIIASFVEAIVASPPPPTIYHYTDDAGLRGIIETGKIWLTDIFNLNDPSELSHGFSHAVKILNSKAVDGPPSSKVFAQNFEEFLTKPAIKDVAHFFVCSFSSTGDDLGQWRAYADNGRGYALGFDAKKLEDAFAIGDDVSIPTNYAFPITYDDGKLIELQRQLVERMFPLLSLPHYTELPLEGTREYNIHLFGSIAMSALRSAVYFKHEAYKNENEYRFLQKFDAGWLPPDVKSRSRRYSLVQYREFDWRSVAAGALKEIIIGPAADRDKAFRFATDCLRSFHREVFEPIHSKIPYTAT